MHIVHYALAQLTGMLPRSGAQSLTPVAFSFGWIPYAVNALAAAVGDGRLMPSSEHPTMITNAHSGYIRTVRSWILDRLFRDHCIRRDTQSDSELGLTITFYRTSPAASPGTPARDWLFSSGVAAILTQLGIAAIPGVRWGRWAAFGVTACGALIALCYGGLPLWHAEKWAARRLAPGQREVACLTGGNGSKNVLVVVSDGHGVRLEDLACARAVHARAPRIVLVAATLVVLSFAQLSATLLLGRDMAYAVAAGAVGLVQNAVAAGAVRSPAALGFHLEGEHVVHQDKVFQALVEAESVEPYVGLCLLPVFFPGGLRKEEEEWRRDKLAQYTEKISAGYARRPSGSAE